MSKTPCSIQDHIIFVTFLVARDKGVAAIETAFPKVRILTGAVDDDLYECWVTGEGEEYEDQVRTWVIRPGMGQVGECDVVVIYFAC